MKYTAPHPVIYNPIKSNELLDTEIFIYYLLTLQPPRLRSFHPISIQSYAAAKARNYSISSPVSYPPIQSQYYTHTSRPPPSVTADIKIQHFHADEVAIPVRGHKPDSVTCPVHVCPRAKARLDWVVNPPVLITNTFYPKFTVTATNNSTNSEYFRYLQFNLTSGSASPSLFTSDSLTAKHTVSNVAIEINDVKPSIFVQDKTTEVIWWRVVFYPKEGNEYITIPAGDSVSLEFSNLTTGIVKGCIVEYYESWIDPDDLENPPIPSNSGFHMLAVEVKAP